MHIKEAGFIFSLEKFRIILKFRNFLIHCLQGVTQATPQEWLVMLTRTAAQLDNVREILRRMGRMGVGYRPNHNTRLRNCVYELARRATVLERNITRVS